MTEEELYHDINLIICKLNGIPMHIGTDITSAQARVLSTFLWDIHKIAEAVEEISADTASIGEKS